MPVCLQVYLFGGAVCSWKQASGDEVLYVRPDAVFDKVRVGVRVDTLGAWGIWRQHVDGQRG